VRYAVVKANITNNDSNVIAQVNRFAQASLHNTSAMTVTVTLLDGCATSPCDGSDSAHTGTSTPPNRVKVSISYTYFPYLSSVMRTPPAMNTKAEGRMIVGGS